MRCASCGRKAGADSGVEKVAAIAGGVMGDEYIETYYFCQACRTYTVEVYHDRFSGEDSITIQGPLTEAQGEAQIAIIRRCSDAMSKHCRCKAHKEYFGSGLV